MEWGVDTWLFENMVEIILFKNNFFDVLILKIILNNKKYIILIYFQVKKYF